MAPNSPYDDGPLFNDEELIKEYAEDEGPPLEYDDAYLEEMMEEHDTNNNKESEEKKENDGGPPNSKNDDKPFQHKEAIGSKNTALLAEVDGDVVMKERNFENASGVPTEVTVAQSNDDMLSLSAIRRDKENNLYSFERLVILSSSLNVFLLCFECIIT